MLIINYLAITSVPGGKIWKLEMWPPYNFSYFSTGITCQITKRLRFGYCLFLIHEWMLTSKKRSRVDLLYVSLAKLEIDFPEFPACQLPHSCEMQETLCVKFGRCKCSKRLVLLCLEGQSRAPCSAGSSWMLLSMCLLALLARAGVGLQFLSSFSAPDLQLL